MVWHFSTPLADTGSLVCCVIFDGESYHDEQLNHLQVDQGAAEWHLSTAQNL